MGLDACIYFKCDKEYPDLEWRLPSGFSIITVKEWDCRRPDGATHEVDQIQRYYGIGYERGSWPDLCACLMLLFASRDVAKVWYGNDEGISECTPTRVLELCEHFMKFSLPYHRPRKETP